MIIHEGALPITPALQRVWRGIATGLTCKEICYSAGVALSTIHQQRTTLYARIGARNMADATRLAVRHGIISVEVMQ